KWCYINISSKTQCMMENIAEEIVKATKKRSIRKRKSIRYRHPESSEEEDHSSDPDYMEKLKRAMSDGMDKDVIIPFVQTLETLEDTTSHEITPDTS
ncbi:11312_t:CDS:2, partial [Funneliformis mosseae]